MSNSSTRTAVVRAYVFENREKKPANKIDPVNVPPDLIYDNNEPADPSPLRHQEKVAEAKAPGCYVCFMKRDEAISRLQQHEADLKRLGVEHLYMFGSTARGEANDDSDVDLFFDYEKGKLGLFELMDVKEYVNARARQPL